MTSGQVQRFLGTQELYDQVLSLISEDTFDEVGGRSVVQGWLDAILSMGKIEGRLTAAEKNEFIFADNDRLIEGWQRIVDSVTPAETGGRAFEYTAEASVVRGVIVTVHDVDGRGMGVCEDGRDAGDALRSARRSMTGLGFIAEDELIKFVRKDST
jgi:hypothetical protein